VNPASPNGCHGGYETLTCFLPLFFLREGERKNILSHHQLIFQPLLNNCIHFKNCDWETNAGCR